MAFFNKKEEVIDLELTPYGEALLSAGKFKPVYYAFFDDDILYDASGSVGVTEVQNTIETRIQSDTPSMKPQALYSGVESNLAPMISFVRNPLVRENITEVYGVEDDDYSYFPPLIDKDFSFVEPIGRMEIGSEHVPSWDIKVLDGQLSAAINYMTSSAASGIYNNVRRIPQLDFDLNYRVLVGTTTRFNIYGEIKDRIISPIYEDGSFLYLSEERPELIFAIDEQNAPVGTHYDVEVFEILPNDFNGREQLRQLFFQKPEQQVKDNILLDEPIRAPAEKVDSSYAEYYFQINSDLEIPEETICPKISYIRNQGFQLDDVPYGCPDVKSVDRLDIYRSNSVPGEGEECD